MREGERQSSLSRNEPKLAFAEIGAPPGRGCYWDAHELRHESTDTVLEFLEWEWADFVDGR